MATDRPLNSLNNNSLDGNHLHNHQHSTLNHRQSLAFELAAAMEPEDTDQSDILNQLGLGGDDDDDDDDDDDPIYDDNEEEDEEEREEEEIENENFIQNGRDEEDVPYYYQPGDDDQSLGKLDHRLSKRIHHSRSSNRLRTTTQGDSQGLDSSLNSPLSISKSNVRLESVITPARRLKRQSRSTLNNNLPSSSSPSSVSSCHLSPLTTLSGNQRLNKNNLTQPLDDYESKSIAPDDEEHSSDDTENSESEKHRKVGELLEAGLTSIGKFLTILRQSNTDFIPPSSVGRGSFLSSNSNQKGEPCSSDRQAVVESLISDLVRTMTDQVRDRESQIRELKEIEIALSRTDRRILAELEELPPPSTTYPDEDRDTARFGSLEEEIETGSSSSGKSEELEEELEEQEGMVDDDEDDDDESGRTTPTTKSVGYRAFEEEQSSKTTSRLHKGQKGLRMRTQKISALDDLKQLKQLTSSLISSLNSINEHTQISRQTQTDVVRRLKGVKGLVSNLRNENESIESSKLFIERWEECNDLKENIPVGRKRIKGLFEVQVNLAIKETEELLEDAFNRASKLLEQRTV
ncbi:hypothetical protein BY996DRAFT_7313388, partial [Phakopsora pachyrhizi]